MDNEEGERAFYRQKIIAKLIELQSEQDTEKAHHEADKLLCEALEACGCGDVVRAWEKVPKWYA